MKKSIVLLLSFCFMFCVICTACAKIPSQNAGESKSTNDTKTTSDLQSTNDTKTTSDLQSTDGIQSSSSEDTTESTTENTTCQKPYEVCYTKIRETKALATEIPELQEKIDRNDKNQYTPECQNKVVIQIGNQRDVPYLFEMGGGQYFKHEYIVYPYFAGNPYFSELTSKKEYMPTYVYTGTETITVELNDEIRPIDRYNMEPNTIRSINTTSLDDESSQSFYTFEEMYEKLPKGKYYVHFHLEVHGNHIFREDGKYIGLESKSIVPAFIVEIK